jgi:hypothetical protein
MMQAPDFRGFFMGQKKRVIGSDFKGNLLSLQPEKTSVA